MRLIPSLRAVFRALPSGLALGLLLSCGGETLLVQEEVLQPGITIIPGSVHLDSQEDVELLSGVVEIRGGLDIRGSETGSPILSLASLASLRTVTSSVSFYNLPQLRSFQGLDSLQSVGWGLYVSEMPLLHDLEGLGGLREITSDFWVEDCSGLTSLSGLDALVSCERLVLRNLPALTNTETLTELRATTVEIEGVGLSHLSGLAQMDSLSLLRLHNNPVLTEVSGLSKLHYVEDLWLQSNPSLTSLAGLSGCEVGGWFSVSFCPKILDLAGLEGIIGLRGSFILRNNDNLMGLRGLENVERIGGQIIITDNPALCDTTIESWQSGVENSGRGLIIRDNGTCPP